MKDFEPLLDLDPAPAKIGRAEVRLVRELTPADLELRATLPTAWSAPQIRKLTQRHHALARMLASGMDNKQAALAAGYDPVRVSQLLQDPSFQELCGFYKEGMDESFQDVAAEMSGLSLDILQEIRTRFEDEPEKFTINTMMEILTKMLDRTGYGPSVKTEQNVTVNYGSRLEAARKRAQDAETLRQRSDGSYAA